MPRSELVEDPVTKPIHDRFVQSIHQLENGLPVEERFPWCWDVAGQRHTPGDLFNGMVAPLIPYGISGILWYQGESSASKARQYGHLFPMLVDSWRERWGDPDLKFYFVQLAGYDGRESGSEIESAWPHLRDVQRRLLDRRENTGMVVAFHLGDSLNIHPPYKKEVGARLANLALHDVYVFRDIVRSSPLLDGVEYRDGAAVLTFRETADGLSSGRRQAAFRFFGRRRRPAFPPGYGYGQSGRGRRDRPSEAVPSPVAVRYGWATLRGKRTWSTARGYPRRLSAPTNGRCRPTTFCRRRTDDSGSWIRTR
ncbi:sialate O-acetylesterase [Alistipes sp. dk3624]|uniref:sialate O-acetylesterase n=1 Tax=Alistipes sp. dk3624 TaxID=2662363 RepID=UPI002939371B|nr:sialate O-acetylesterase [Alistipes sp. dk3624]